MGERNTTIRDRHRARIARHQPPCGICGDPIDYDLPHTDPRSFVVDHVLPLAAGGTQHADNTQAAHRDCNRTKSDAIPEGMHRAYITNRTWT